MKNSFRLSKFLSWWLFVTFPLIAGAAPIQGPGLPNLTYQQSELFTSLSKIVTTPIGTNIGNNTASMMNGYLMMTNTFNGGHHTGGLSFWDISDPRNPVQAVEYDGGVFETIGESHWYSWIHINGKDLVALPGNGELPIYDVTDVNNVTQLSAVPTGTITGYFNNLWQVIWSPPYIFASAREGGIKVIDASDPTNPTLLTTISTAQTGGVNIGPMYVVGNLLVGSALDNQSGFVTMDVADPLNPILLGVDTSSNVSCCFGYSAYFSQNMLFSTDNSGTYATLHIFDVSDPTQFVHIGQTESAVASFDGYQMIQDGFIHAGIHDGYGTMIPLRQFKKMLPCTRCCLKCQWETTLVP